MKFPFFKKREIESYNDELDEKNYDSALSYIYLSHEKKSNNSNKYDDNDDEWGFFIDLDDNVINSMPLNKKCMYIIPALPTIREEIKEVKEVKEVNQKKIEKHSNVFKKIQKYLLKTGLEKSIYFIIFICVILFML